MKLVGSKTKIGLLLVPTIRENKLVNVGCENYLNASGSFLEKSSLALDRASSATVIEG